jgi:hypothetical protein
MAYVTRRSALTIIARGGFALAAGRARAEDKIGRAIYPVARSVKSPTRLGETKMHVIC